MKLQMIWSVARAAASPCRKRTPTAPATNTRQRIAQRIDKKAEVALVCGRWKAQYAKPNAMEKQVTEAHRRQSGNCSVIPPFYVAKMRSRRYRRFRYSLAILTATVPRA